MFKTALDILNVIFLHADIRSASVLSIVILVVLLVGVVYKLSSNHINHLTMSINDLNTTLRISLDKFEKSVERLNTISRKEHSDMIASLNRITGRLD